MDIKTTAVLLALFSVVGLFFLGYVLRIQIPLLKVRDTPLYQRMRYALFFIVLATFLGTSILLAIDLVTIFFGIKRSASVINPIGILVVFTSAIVMTISALGFAVIYWLIVKDNATAARLATKNESDRSKLQGEKDVLQADNDKLHKEG